MYVLTKKEYMYLSMYDGGISVVLTVQEWLSQPVELSPITVTRWLLDRTPQGFR